RGQRDAGQRPLPAPGVPARTARGGRLFGHDLDFVDLLVDADRDLELVAGLQVGQLAGRPVGGNGGFGFQVVGVLLAVGLLQVEFVVLGPDVGALMGVGGLDLVHLLVFSDRYLDLDAGPEVGKFARGAVRGDGGFGFQVVGVF